MNLVLVTSVGFLVFSFYLFFLYFFCFRFLKFLVSVEISLVLMFLFLVMQVWGGEVSFLLLYLSLAACGAAMGLSMMVSWFRFMDSSLVAMVSMV